MSSMSSMYGMGPVLQQKMLPLEYNGTYFLAILILRDWIKSSGKFAILYLYKIGGGRGSEGTFGKIKIQDSMVNVQFKIERGMEGCQAILYGYKIENLPKRLIPSL